MASSEWANRLNNPDLRCRNKCGFYGNPMYQGYCSKCYKEVSSREGKVQPPPTTTPVVKGQEIETGTEGLGFAKFTRRKTLFNSAKGHGKIFKAPLKIKGTQSPSEEEPIKSSKTRRSSDPFNEFMKTLKKPAAQDIVQHLKNFKRQIVEKSSTATIDELSDAVQEFYRSTSERLVTHPLFKTMSEQEQEETMDGIEKHLTTSIYRYVFAPPSCDDEIKDLLFVRRINMLHWLEPTILDVVLDLNNREVQGIIEQARQELWTMEAKKAPQDKLYCIAKSCKLLLDALRLSHGGPASADEFVPGLIFLVIHTSPQHLHSNINYITRFSNPIRIMSGECGYYFTNLCGAMTFIENISAEKLKMSQDDFNNKMGYINGKTDADLLIEEYDDEEMNEDIVIMESLLEAVDKINERLTDMSNEVDTMMLRLDELKAGVQEQVQSVLSGPPPKSLYKKKSSPNMSTYRAPPPPPPPATSSGPVPNLPAAPRAQAPNYSAPGTGFHTNFPTPPRAHFSAPPGAHFQPPGANFPPPPGAHFPPPPGAHFPLPPRTHFPPPPRTHFPPPRTQFPAPPGTHAPNFPPPGTHAPNFPPPGSHTSSFPPPGTHAPNFPPPGTYTSNLPPLPRTQMPNFPAPGVQIPNFPPGGHIPPPPGAGHVSAPGTQIPVPGSQSPRMRTQSSPNVTHHATSPPPLITFD